MMDSRLAAQRAMRNLGDQGQQKTSTYIVPCFLFVEVSVCLDMQCIDQQGVTHSFIESTQLWISAWSDLNSKSVFFFFGGGYDLKATFVIFGSIVHGFTLRLSCADSVD